MRGRAEPPGRSRRYRTGRPSENAGPRMDFSRYGFVPLSVIAGMLPSPPAPKGSITSSCPSSENGPPSGRWSFSSTARSAAPVESVWPLVGEAERWKEWSWMNRTYLLRPGQPVPDGVGAVRRFALGPSGSKEEVVAWDPPHHLGYVVLQRSPRPPLPGRRRPDALTVTGPSSPGGGASTRSFPVRAPPSG